MPTEEKIKYREDIFVKGKDSYLFLLKLSQLSESTIAPFDRVNFQLKKKKNKQKKTQHSMPS